VAETVQLTATFRAADGTVLTDRVPVWTTSDVSVATVDAAGLVTGVGAGNATLTATAGNRSGIAAIRVEQSATAQAVDAGGDFSCAIRSAEVQCWGNGGYGQLGNNSARVRAAPAPVSSVAVFTSVSTGADAACALTVTREVYCWGAGNLGQVGDGSAVMRLTPTRIASGFAFMAVEAGDRFACALTATGNAQCWGINTHG
jgi:alpha-tubulin suppressor-like RCC1 family protein